MAVSRVHSFAPPITLVTTPFAEQVHKLVLLGEQQLRRAISEFVEHYHLERNHQGLDHRLLTSPTPPSNDSAPMVRRERLGGILNYYHRSAA
jgi:putative transposase